MRWIFATLVLAGCCGTTADEALITAGIGYAEQCAGYQEAWDAMLDELEAGNPGVDFSALRRDLEAYAAKDELLAALFRDAVALKEIDEELAERVLRVLEGLAGG